MSNKYDRHIAGDKWKWIVTLIAFLCVGVLIMGLMTDWFVNWNKYGWFDKPKEDQPGETTACIPEVTDGEGNELLTDGTVQEMPERMVFYGMAATAHSVVSEESGAEGNDGFITRVKIAATVTPENYPTNSANVRWSVRSLDPSDSWCAGKTMSDYIELVDQSANGLEITVGVKKGFGTKLCIDVSLEDKVATCVCDFKAVLTGMRFNHLPAGGSEAQTVDLMKGNDTAITIGASKDAYTSTLSFVEYLYSSEEYTIREEPSCFTMQLNYTPLQGPYTLTVQNFSNYEVAMSYFPFNDGHWIPGGVSKITSFSKTIDPNELLVPFKGHYGTENEDAEFTNYLISNIMETFRSEIAEFFYYEISVYSNSDGSTKKIMDTTLTLNCYVQSLHPVVTSVTVDQSELELQ